MPETKADRMACAVLAAQPDHLTDSQITEVLTSHGIRLSHLSMGFAELMRRAAESRALDALLHAMREAIAPIDLRHPGQHS